MSAFPTIFCFVVVLAVFHQIARHFKNITTTNERICPITSFVPCQKDRHAKQQATTNAKSTRWLSVTRRRKVAANLIYSPRQERSKRLFVSRTSGSHDKTSLGTTRCRMHWWQETTVPMPTVREFDERKSVVFVEQCDIALQSNSLWHAELSCKLERTERDKWHDYCCDLGCLQNPTILESVCEHPWALHVCWANDKVK